MGIRYNCKEERGTVKIGWDRCIKNVLEIGRNEGWMPVCNRSKVITEGRKGEKFGSGGRLFFEGAHRTQLLPSLAQTWRVGKLCTDVFVFGCVQRIGNLGSEIGKMEFKIG